LLCCISNMISYMNKTKDTLLIVWELLMHHT